MGLRHPIARVTLSYVWHKKTNMTLSFILFHTSNIPCSTVRLPMCSLAYGNLRMWVTLSFIRFHTSDIPCSTVRLLICIKDSSYIYTHTNLYVCICIHIYSFVYVYTPYTSETLAIYIHMQICMFVYSESLWSIWCIHIYKFVYVCIYTSTYLYIYIHE